MFVNYYYQSVLPFSFILSCKILFLLIKSHKLFTIHKIIYIKQQQLFFNLGFGGYLVSNV